MSTPPVRVLVIDDNHHMRLILKGMLRALRSPEVQEAADGVEALERMKSWRPDLVICDYVMPQLDGVEFVRMVRWSTDSPCWDVPIILVTGYAERRVVMAARDAGADAFIAKPLQTLRLLEKIDYVLPRRRAFVKSPRYIGPCRRNGMNPTYAGPFRRKDDYMPDAEGDAPEAAAAAAAG